MLLQIVFTVVVLAGQPAWAQAPAKPAVPAAEAMQARAALDVLKDDKKRADLIRVLEAIAKAQPAPAAVAEVAPGKPETPPIVVPLAPDIIGAQLIAGVSERLSHLGGDLVGLLHAATDFPLLWFWLQVVAFDQATHALMLDVAWRLAVVLALALTVGYGVRRLLRRPLAALAALVPVPEVHEPADAVGIAEAERGNTELLPRRLPGVMALLRRLPEVLGGFVLELLPVLAMLAVGYACLGAGLAPAFAPRTVIVGVLHAVALYQVVMALACMLLSARAPGLTLFSPDPATAASALGWIRLVARLAIFGTTFAETALLFGMYTLAHDTLLKLLGLAVTLVICVALLRHRAGIAGLIRAFPATSSLGSAIRGRIAETWHVVAIVYLMSLWLVWALEVSDGFSRLLRLTVATLLVIGLAKLASNLLLGGLKHVLEGDADAPEAADGMARRMRHYHPLAYGLGRIVIGAVAVLALLEAWGIPALSWFASDRLGGRLIGALANLGTTVVIALLTWEATNLGIQRHLSRLAAEHQAARSARLRTLLPMLRTTLLVAICLVTGLMALSEIGVNIAPLLAGAGVVGLAIGFGSQKLVQDIITGLFLLLENAMQVGDSVTLGGLTGSVENLSIRTIRLRALDGSVHIIPFSAVTTVTNMTRDFGYAVIDVKVGLNEPPEKIADILRDIAREMRDDPAWAATMTGELDVMGVDSFQPQSYTLRARVRTTPGGRWAIGREMNKRIKDRFDAIPIESPITSYRALHIPTPEPEAPAA